MLPRRPSIASRTLSDEVLDIAEYKIVERVEAKLLKRAWLLLAIFGAGIGLVGVPALISHISDAVKGQITTNLEKSSQALDERLRKSLVDQQLAAAEIERAASQAHARLRNSSEEIDQLAKVPLRYAELAGRIDSLQVRVNELVTRTEQQLAAAKVPNESAVRSITLLQLAAFDPNSTRPKVLGSNFGSQGGTVVGVNFGSSKGRLVQFIYPTTQGAIVPTKSWVISPSSITVWTDKRIEYSGTFAIPTPEAPHVGFTVEAAESSQATK